MKNYVLKTESLSKNYNNNKVLSNISISLERGKIYGLIGQNGAGKTTFMRMVAGLSFPTSGTIELFGQKGEKELIQARKRIGCLIEYPSINGNMNAKENMTLNRIMMGIPNQEIENELLELVGLSDTGKKKAKDFSLGMKQRLGIAISLIGNPELLILDEPVNGLDPIGIVEVRNLIKQLCTERNMTILISSHILPELYQIATDYIIIHKGSIKQTFSLEQLDEYCMRHILINTEQTEKLVGILEMKLNTTNYKVMPDKSIKLYDFLDEKEKLAKVLFENGIIVTNLSVGGENLEDYFIDVVGGSSNV